MTSSHGIMLTYVPDMPSGDLKNPALVKRIAELLETQGWVTQSSTPMIWKGRQCVQFIAQRRDMLAGKLIGVARATMRGRTLYLVTAYGKGEADRADDPEFMRVMETFRLIDQPTIIIDHPEGPSARTYRFAMIGAGGAAAMLLMALVVVIFLSRVRDEESA